jgi:succinylglutamic semialdehyde dehydrogenase
LSTPQIVSYEPATGTEIWRRKYGNVDDIVDRARRAWPAWAAQPLANRMELMRRFANEVRKVSDKLATLIARETGKPMWEARTEVESVIGKVEISIRAYAERTAQRKLDNAMQGTASLRHKPHGVMAVLGPYNFPAHLPNGHIVPALIAGNAIVFKPSEKTPATGELLLQCFHRAGVSAAVVQLLVGGPEEGQALVGHDGINGVLFTGSAHTGIAINRRLAARPDKILALEMGGNNPLVVWNTPKVTDAAALVVQSAFTSAGQRCTAARRLIVKSSMYDALIAEVKNLADRVIVGAPFDDPAPFMGPVIDNDAADGLTESFLYLLSHGGKAIKHLVRPRDDLPFLSPSIIDVSAVKDRLDVELFGPLLQVVRVDDFDFAGWRHPAGIRSLLGQRSRRSDQLEPPDQRRQFGGAVWRGWAVGQSPPKCLLRGRLLRLSGRLERDGPAARHARRGLARHLSYSPAVKISTSVRPSLR